jgi:hypothetical protein
VTDEDPEEYGDVYSPTAIKSNKDCSFYIMKENVVQRMLQSYLERLRRRGTHLLLFLYLSPMIGMPLKKDF